MFTLIFTHSGQSSPEISIAIDAESCELIFSDSGGSDGTALQIPSGNGTVPDLSQGSLSQHSPFGFVDSSSASEREADGIQLIANSQTPKRSDNDSDAPPLNGHVRPRRGIEMQAKLNFVRAII